MGGLFKILLFTSPVLALIFFYVVSQQSKLDTEIKKDEAEFHRSWNEFESDFAKTPKQKQKYDSRAREADEEIKRLKEGEAEKERKAEEFERQFERAIEEFEKSRAKNSSALKNRR